MGNGKKIALSFSLYSVFSHCSIFCKELVFFCYLLLCMMPKGGMLPKGAKKTNSLRKMPQVNTEYDEKLNTIFRHFPLVGPHFILLVISKWLGLG